MKHKRGVKAIIGLIVITLMLSLFNLPALATDPTWVTKASMGTARYSFQTVELNSKIYAIGGYNGSSALSSVEMYDPATNTWSTKASMSTARYEFKTAVINGKIYVIGCRNSAGIFSSIEAYDPATNTWSTKASMPTARCRVQIEIINGKIYVIGGMNSSNALSTTEVYDPVANTWATLAPMSNARWLFQTEVIDGKIYAIGGHNGAGALSSVEIYDLASNTWTTRASMSAARYDFQTEAIDGKIYAIGGYSSSALSSVEMYDPLSNTWITRASMSNARQGLQSEVIDGKIYTIGGVSGSNYSSIAEIYDTALNTWSTLPSMSNARYNFQTELFSNTIFSIGGQNGSYLSSVESYTPVTPPAAPTLTATPGDAQVTLNWNSVIDATSYNVYRSTTSGGTYTQIATGVTGTTSTDTGLTNGTTYYYVVTAVNDAGESDYSNEVSATPQAALKGLLRITMTTGLQKEYDLSESEIDTFVDWYNGNASGSPSYMFNKTYYLGTLTSRKEYVAFSNIAFFEVMAYEEDGTPATPSGTNTALLSVTMAPGDIMQYEITSAQLASFTDWYGSGASTCPTFAMSKFHDLGPFVSRTDYLVFDKIVDFEVLEY
ncbi:kelch repeat-containing protein [Oscillospiraceae bacterium WX1]